MRMPTLLNFKYVFLAAVSVTMTRLFWNNWRLVRFLSIDLLRCIYLFISATQFPNNKRYTEFPLSEDVVHRFISPTTLQSPSFSLGREVVSSREGSPSNGTSLEIRRCAGGWESPACFRPLSSYRSTSVALIWSRRYICAILLSYMAKNLVLFDFVSIYWQLFGNVL